jgi:hypothetical protein
MENIEKVNEQIAFLTTGMVKVPLVDDTPTNFPGTTVSLYAKEAGGEPALEITTYDPGTPIDSEHASLLDDAPDMAKLLHGDPEDITTTRVLVLDLADGVGCTCDEIQTEAERSQSETSQTYVNEAGNTVPRANISFTPDAGAEMVNGQISGTAEISIPGKDASTHPFDGVVSHNVIAPGVDLSKAVLTTYDATRAEVDAVYAKGGMPTEAQLEALDPLGQEEDDEAGAAI